MDFIEKHPSFIVAIFGIAAILLSVLCPEFAALGANLFFFGAIALYYAGIFVLIFNIAAMIAFLKDKPAAGVILSLPFGGLGAVIGLLFNPSYEYEIAVKIIFSIQLWLGIWAVASAMLG
ncbi:MAG: hypothetical protein K2N60_12910 [Oscillospiraceae bacterium]|nr:hypothetical protein [Oscillospiraceae bacterium]